MKKENFNTMTIAILGSSGMIGSAANLYLSKLNYRIIEVNRSGESITGSNETRKFDVLTGSVDDLLKSFPEGTVVINLIGMIRHKIKAEESDSKLTASRINAEFPRDLVLGAENLGLRVIQIATDCIYSGKNGPYSENAIADPVDVYGYTKAAGELIAKNLLTLRVSIVGRELKEHVELMDWVMNQEINSVLNGFRNHRWNGITSLHFAKILDGILREDIHRMGTFHVVPKGSVSKYELIKMISEISGRKDLTIMEIDAENSINRTLISKYPQINEDLWKGAGYLHIPTIRIMLEEYFNWSNQIDQGE